MMIASLALGLLTSLPALPAQEPDRIIRLRDGRLIVGVVEDHDLDGFRLVAARDGGRMELAWAQLFPGEAERLRESFGYRAATTMPTTHASRVLLINGQERIGRVIHEDDTQIELRTFENTVVLPKNRLAAPPEPVIVPVPSVLTPEQFYTERAPEIASDDRLAQYDFAQQLEAVFALERAGEHYAIAQALAEEASDAPLLQRLEGAQQKLAVTLANREEAEALEQIRQLMHRERFTAAKELLDGWDSTFPASALRGEMLKLEDDFAEDRDRAMTRYLRRNWYSRAVALLKRKSLERDSTVDQLFAWLEADVPQTIRQQMAEELEPMQANLTLAEIDRLWLARLDTSPARHKAGYGDGSWILGTEKARAGLKAQESDENDGKSEEQRAMEERMQRYLRNLEAQKRAGAAADDDVSPEDWWRRSRTTQRFQFLLAYYAEFSGDFQITGVSFTNCSTCAGSGVIESVELNENGANQRRVKCPTCHQVGVRRSVAFR